MPTFLTSILDSVVNVRMEYMILFYAFPFAIMFFLQILLSVYTRASAVGVVLSVLVLIAAVVLPFFFELDFVPFPLIATGILMLITSLLLWGICSLATRGRRK